MEESNGLVTWIAAQPWYVTASMVMAGATMISMFVSDRWADKYPVLKQVNDVLNFISGNFFRNKNAK